jgi:LmbE family N-acetylglucosaminyl deacetylase
MQPRAAAALSNGSGPTDLVERILASGLLVLAPHMDDEALACGGTILLHEDPARVHCLFATDGAASPAPLLPWLGKTDAGLAARRRRRPGMPRRCWAFHMKTSIPRPARRRLAPRRIVLEAALARSLERLRPEFVFAPFRFDVHPDHVALNRATRRAAAAGGPAHAAGVLRLPPAPRRAGGRRARRARADRVHAGAGYTGVATRKRAALDCYVSQATRLYDWQERPILTEDSLRQRCAEPECFLLSEPGAPLTEGFAGHVNRIRLATLAMRFGKRPKDRAVALARWALGR